MRMNVSVLKQIQAKKENNMYHATIRLDKRYDGMLIAHCYPNEITIGRNAVKLFNDSNHHYKFPNRHEFIRLCRSLTHESVHLALDHMKDLEVASTLLDYLFVHNLDNYDDTGLPMLGLAIHGLPSMIKDEQTDCWGVDPWTCPYERL